MTTNYPFRAEGVASGSPQVMSPTCLRVAGPKSCRVRYPIIDARAGTCRPRGLPGQGWNWPPRAAGECPPSGGSARGWRSATASLLLGEMVRKVSHWPSRSMTSHRFEFWKPPGWLYMPLMEGEGVSCRALKVCTFDADSSAAQSLLRQVLADKFDVGSVVPGSEISITPRQFSVSGPKFLQVASCERRRRSVSPPGLFVIDQSR